MKKKLTVQEAGRLGAIETNKVLTPAMRSKAAKKGWRNRKHKLQEKSFTVK